jgi:nucleoside-diphosphate-sugar epimerase
MKIFLTGGSGYIGQATIRALRRRGHEVTALVRSDDAAEAVAAVEATPVRGELGALDVLRRSAAEADGAIHLAQARGPQTADVDRDAAAAIQDGVGSGPYVHTSGAWVYGNTDGVVDETAPLAPPPVVAWRLDNEKRVLERASSGGRPIVVAPGLVYGTGAGLIEQFFVAPARARGVVHYIGDGTNRWALVHVDDIAELYALALDGAPGSVFAGVTDYSLTVGQIAQALSEAAGCPGRAESVTLDEARATMGPIADAFALDQQISSARARTHLGWTPLDRDVLDQLAHPLGR